MKNQFCPFHKIFMTFLFILIIQSSYMSFSQDIDVNIYMRENEKIKVDLKTFLNDPSQTFSSWEINSGVLPVGWIHVNGIITGDGYLINGCEQPNPPLKIKAESDEGSIKTFNLKFCKRKGICFPDYSGFYGEPQIDGIFSDSEWSKAYRVTHANASGFDVAFQCMKNPTGDYIYLSFEVNNDATFDENDVILLNFRPKITGYADPAAQIDDSRMIKIFPKKTFPIECYSMANLNSKITVDDIQQATVFEDSGNKWITEIRVPINKIKGGENWIEIDPNGFLFYYNVCRFYDVYSEFKWPKESPIVSNNINLYLNYQNDFGVASLGNSSECTGVYIADRLDIGSNNPNGSSEIKLTGSNTFYARVSNSDQNTANGIKATFRLANWGIQDQNNPDYPGLWEKINAAENPVTKDVISTITNQKTEFTFNWEITDSDLRQKYQANPHQCMLVELESNSGTNIISKGMYRNMDFVTASKFSRKAEISAKGFGLAPKGFDKHKILLQVTKNDYSKSKKDQIASDSLVQTKGNKTIAPVEKEVSSCLNYTVHGYRYTGQKLIVNEKAYDIVDPIGSYGYVVCHDGPVKKWKTQLLGAKMINPNNYLLEIAKDSSIMIEDIIKPLERKWSVSIHGGISSPSGSFANNYDKGSNIMLDLDYHFCKNLALVMLFGYNDFKSKTSGIDDMYWLNLNANIRYYIPFGGKWSVFAGAGPGIYFPESGSQETGLNAGLGINFEASNLINFELGTEYHYSFNSDLKYMQYHLGIVFRF